jgi:hypothetical protein
MRFTAFVLRHGERAPWEKVTHIRLTGRQADSPAGQRMVDYIAARANDGIVALSQIGADFPTYKKQGPLLKRVCDDLRYLANQRDSGRNPKDKGLIELGRLE